MAETNHVAFEEGREVQTARVSGEEGGLGYGSVSCVPDAVAGTRTGSTLHAKLWAILTDIERLPKDKANTQGSGYKYLSESALKERFHPLFVKHGILLVPTRSTEPVTTPPSGTKSSYITTFTQSFAILDLESGERLEMEIAAQGGDSLDKGVWKGITGAIKYVLTTLFLIPTGDDPEADGATPKERMKPQPKAQGKQDPESVITEPQLKRLFAICSARKIDAAYAKDLIHEFGYESSKLIKAKDYEAICAKLEAV
jgi:hypothetical protein